MHRTRIALPSQGRRNDLIDEPQGRLLRQRPNGEPIPTLKTELDNPRQYATRADAQRDIFNRTRLHSAIGYISPIEMKQKAAYTTSPKL